MKTNKTIFLLVSFVFVFVIVSVFSSCDLLNNPIEDYLEEYTEKVTVNQSIFSEDYPEDEDDIMSVPSSEDCEIVYELRNPQLYTLDSTLTFASGITATENTDYTVTEDSSAGYVTLVLKKSFLTEHWQGQDINPTIVFTDDYSGRSFDSYSLEFRCNSVPSTVTNTTALLYTNDDETCYLICFNLPDTLGSDEIDGDVTTLTITNESSGDVYSYALDNYSINGTGTELFTSYDSDDMTVNPATESTFTTGNYPCYFETGIEQSTDSNIIDISLTDEKKLESSISINTNSNKLCTVTATGEDTTLTDGNTNVTEIISGDESDTASFTITAPGKDTTDKTVDGIVTVNYTVTDNTTNKVYSSGSGDTSVTFTLPHNGSDGFTISAWASNDAYVDSDTTTYIVNPIPYIIYVSEDGNDSNYGSEDSPFASLSQAVSECTNDTVNDSGYTIYLSGSTTADTVASIDDDRNITIIGQSAVDTDIVKGDGTCQLLSIKSECTVAVTGITFENGYSSSTGGGIYNAGLLSLTDCKITGCSSAGNGSGIYDTGSMTLSGNTIVDTSTDDLNDIYLTSGTTITVDSLTGTDTVAEITPEVTDDDTVILKSSDELDYTTISRFILNVDNKCLALSDDKLSSIIATSGITIEIDGEPTTYALSANYDETSNIVTMTVTDSSSDISTSLESWTITVLDSSNRETGITTTGTTSQPSVTLAFTNNTELPSGTYNILLEFTYNDISYSATVQITKS